MTTTTHAIDIDTRIADSLRQQLGPQKFSMWFDGSARFAYQRQDHRLTVTVPTQFACNWIERHFRPDLRAAAEQTTGDKVELDLQVDSATNGHTHAIPANTAQAPAIPAPVDRPFDGPVGGPFDQAIDRPQSDGAAPAFGSRAERPTPGRPGRNGPGQFKHRLAQFVTGPSNQLAYAAAQRAADLHDPTANHPVFLHGGCGVGKTHLLQGICAQARQNNPGAKVLYLTAEQFTNDYITAVRGNRLEAFRKRIRRLDLLAIDDVHFLACKEKTQTEFLCCFEENDLAGARIILASDSHPKRIRSFSEALISRCVRGLVVEMTEPDPTTRRAVLNELARRRGLMLQPAVLDLLGQRYTGSVREIEGVLSQLHALVSLQTRGRVNTPNQRLVVGRELVEQLPEFNTPTVRRPVRFNTILKIVCERLAVEPAQLAGSSRHKYLVLARSLSAYLARELTTMSYPEIAHAMGRKNHSTVITADQRLRRQIVADEPIMLPAGEGSVTPSELASSLCREAMRVEV